MRFGAPSMVRGSAAGVFSTAAGGKELSKGRALRLSAVNGVCGTNASMRSEADARDGAGIGVAIGIESGTSDSGAVIVGAASAPVRSIGAVGGSATTRSRNGRR